MFSSCYFIFINELSVLIVIDIFYFYLSFMIKSLTIIVYQIKTIHKEIIIQIFLIIMIIIIDNDYIDASNSNDYNDYLLYISGLLLFSISQYINLQIISVLVYYCISCSIYPINMNNMRSNLFIL